MGNNFFFHIIKIFESDYSFSQNQGKNTAPKDKLNTKLTYIQIIIHEDKFNLFLPILIELNLSLIDLKIDEILSLNELKTSLIQHMFNSVELIFK